MNELYWVLFKGRSIYFVDTRNTVYGLADDIANFLVKYELYKGSVYGFAFKEKSTMKKLCFFISMCKDPEGEFHAQFFSLTGEESVFRKFGPGSVIERVFRENFVVRSSFDLGIRNGGSYMLVMIDFRNDILLSYNYCGEQKLPSDATHIVGGKCNSFMVYTPSGAEVPDFSSESNPEIRDWIYLGIEELYKKLSEKLGIPER